MSVVIKPVVVGFVARLEGIDAVRSGDDDIAAVKSAMREHAVVVLPGQTLSEDDQVAFARRFGTLDTYPEASSSYNRGMRSDLRPISKSGDSSGPANLRDRRRLLDIGNKLWHTDSSFKPVPAHLSMLYGIQVSPTGGETQFADMRAACDGLSDEWEALAEGLVAEHSVFHSRQMLGFDDWDEAHRRKFETWVAHDVVRTLPETGRQALYLSSHAGRIVGMPVPMGRMVLHELTEMATEPANVYSHVWTPNDMVIWDSRCTMHRVRRYPASSVVRVLRRATTVDPAFQARDPEAVVVPDAVLEAAA